LDRIYYRRNCTGHPIRKIDKSFIIRYITV